ncbi:hypothetical protein WICPIJ_003345, partial [Wickerhamomyces pijperi]
MSRIIIKGLPKYLTEDRLKDHFATKGEITDVKLRKNFKGESRRFAFIGFKNADDAENAVKYFDGSFIDTSKIEVSVAKSFVDPTVPKSFKEKKKEAFDKLKERERRQQAREEKEREFKKQKLNKNKKSRIDEEIDSNPQLKEYMEAMKPASQSKSWSNDVVVNENNGLDQSGSDNLLLNKVMAMKTDDSANDMFKNDIADEIFKVDEESDDEYENFDSNSKKDEEPEEKMFSLSDLPQDTESNKDQDGEEDMEDEEKKKTEEEISDLEWLKKRRIRVKENGEIVGNDATQEASTEEEQNQQ